MTWTLGILATLATASAEAQESAPEAVATGLAVVAPSDESTWEVVGGFIGGIVGAAIGGGVGLASGGTAIPATIPFTIGGAGVGASVGRWLHRLFGGDGP